MPQITKDPLGNDVELLNLTEWSDKNQKELNEDTLNQYAGYATGQFLRAGQKPEDFQDKLYSGLFQKGQQVGVFQPQDEAQTTQLFENFANKPLTDDAEDLDLVSKSLLSTDPEQAARVADVYQRVKSGQPDPNLELDLEDVRKNIATPDRVQAARIGYAKERGLGFIDYPTDEPGRRDVWVNNQVNPDRKAIYDTLDLAQGIVDPRSAALAEEWIKTDEGRTTNRWGQRTNSEIQSLLQERLAQADPESAFQQNMASAIEYASESTVEYGVEADVTAKAPTEKIATEIYTPYGPVRGADKKVSTNRVADAAIRSAYKNLKQTDPNNALVTEYNEDQFLNAARDFVRQRITSPVNQDDPTKNFVALTDGTRVPLSSAALLPKEKFAQAMDTLGLDEKEKAAAAATRTGFIASNIDEIEKTLYDFEGDEFMNFVQKNKEQYGNNRVKITEAYIDNIKPSALKTWTARTKGVARTLWASSYDVGTTIGLAAAEAADVEFAKEAYKDSLIASAELENRRKTYVGMYGGELGLGYTIASQAAPLLADILISKGAGSLAKQAAKPVVGSAIRTTEGLMGQTAKTFIGNALKPETKSLVGNYLKKFTVAGTEKSPAQILRAVRRDLEEKFVAGTATATQIGTSFTRSAQSAWTNTTLRMGSETNADGTPKYTEEEINDAAVTSALYSGSITALVERGFGKVFGEGADVTAIGTANIRQLKNYSNRLTNALERGGFGGPELFDTLKQVSREVVNEGWGDAIKQVPAEALEEFTDEFTQNVVQNLLDDEQINFKQAFTQGLQAAVVGGVYGGAIGTTNKIGLRQADIARDTFAGTAQAIERDLMDRTVTKLQESGGNPQTIAALQDRMRVAQRRGQAISQNIPVRAAKQELIDKLDATSEEPFEVPMAPVQPPTPKTPATVTKLASQLAKELAVNEEELNLIQPSGTNKQGAPQITPNDVRAFVNRRTEQMGLDLNSFLPGPDIAAPEGGFQLVGEERADDPENRTFDDLKNRVVVIDGLRGRLRIEDEGVILDREDGSTPFEVTPNKNLPIKDFEGFNTLLQEGAAVSPRRQAREVSEVTDGGQVVYGDTTYDLPEQPLVTNVKKDAAGNVESMHMRVFNSKGLATWVYVAGDNVPKVETSYRTRGPEAVTSFTNAVENAGREVARRNIAAQTFKSKQSKQRRQEKRIKNKAPLITDRGQRAVEAAPDYRATRINQPEAPQQLVEEIRAVATQLGIDPEVYTDDAELFALVAPELAAGLDLEAFTPQQKSQAVKNLARNDNNPETLLEYLISDELLPPQERVKRDTNIAALRARNSNQLKKHSIKPGASVKTILENVARTASNRAHRESAKELLRLGADSIPTSFTYLSNNIGIAGAYLPKSNAVVVNLASDNGGGALDAMLHELGHAVTDRVVTAPANEFEQQVRDRLMSLRSEYVERAKTKYGDNMPPDLRYALEGRASLSEPFNDVDGARELVAHFYGSSKFREQLIKLSPKGERNFVQKFIDLIASLFSGQPVASKQYRELAETIADLSNANQTIGTNPYGRTVGRIAASRAAVSQRNKVGSLYGVPNPRGRADFEWVTHQAQTLQYAKLSNSEINKLITTGKFGMLTGENPKAVEGYTEKQNSDFNLAAVKWLKDRGYEVIPVVGRYEGLGENSFLVPGLTEQDAIDAAHELQQATVATDSGLYNSDGTFNPRVGQDLDRPIGDQDDFFSSLLDSNGNITTIRVAYDTDTVLDSGLRYSKQDEQAAPVTKIAKSLAAQGEFEIVENREINKPLQFENGRLLVNPALADARYEGYDNEDAADLQELDARLAVAIGMANKSTGPEIQLNFEEVGLSPDSVIEQAAYNTFTNADLQDLLKVKDQAKQFIASAYYHIALRNNGDNERLATAQNRVADLYRYLLRDGAGLPDGPEKFNPLDIGPVTQQLVNRSKAPAPIVRYSRAAVDIDPVEVRSRTKAGKAVGTRNPTSAKATEDGADPSNLVDLASLKRNPQAYRKNALLLLEYPIVAREFPELAKEYAKIRGAVLKAQDKAKANGIKIKGAKDTAKKTLASYLGVTKAKVSGKMLEDAIENPESAFVTKEQPGTIAGNKEARARNKALAAFNKNLDQIKKYEAEGVVLGTDSSKALKTYTDTLDKIAKDPKHPIANQADEIYNTLIEVTKSNLRVLMDVFPSDIRDIANLWYDGANIIAQQFAGDNYSIEQSAGVLAVFSPQKDWFMNVELAKRTMEIWTADQEYEWDDAMSKQWLMRGGEPELKENKDGTVGYAKGIKPDLDENGEHRTDGNGMLLFHGWGSEKVKAKRQQAFERLQSLKGKKLKDLTPEQQAWFVRMRAETKYPTGYPIVSPDGRFGNPSTSTNNKGVTKEIKLAWGTYGSIGKAINILTAPAETQMKVISDELGDQHKVRSFYNNIVDPQNNDGHVTMDTHAIAALFWQAFSGNSREVGQNFGTANTATDSLTGVGGLYPAFAEAYRAVAAEYGMLPRQVQSITWEAVRMLFSARWKSKPTNVNGVRAKWVQYQNNEINLDQAQTAVFAMATNGKDLATAVANSNDEELGLGFPSWADVTEGPAPEGVGIALSRAAGANTAPKAFRGRTVQLTHWSKATELKQTDPTEHGNGGAGKELERRREYGDIYVPRTYFGYGKYRRETQVGVNRYSMLVDGDSLYDLDRDPLDLYPDQDALQKAGYARFDNRAALTLFERAIKDAGFKGYVSTSYQAGVLFNKQKVTKVKDGDISLPLAAPGEPEIPTKKPRYSKALYAITSPDPESAFAVSLDDLYVNKATGEWDAGGPVSRLFRASGNMDPRLFEAAKYQERGLRLAKVRLKDLMQSFQAALKAEPNADLDDVNLALGSTEPTVTAAQRDAAESTRRARIDKANEAFDKAPANKAYLDAVNTARVNYAVHRSKQKYTAEIQQAREDRKNSPEIQLRNAAIAAADAQYSKDIQAARMSNLAPVRKAQQQAQLRLEQNSPETAAAIANFRVAIDNLSSQLIDELDPGDPLRAIVDQNLGVYLTRTYRIHQDEGYAQRVLEDSEFASQRTRARAFFEKQWIDNTYDLWRKDVAYEPYSDSEVMALVRAEAKSKDVGTRELYKFVDKHNATPKTFGRATNRTDLTRFMQKGEVPPELRMLLGEVQNPIENALRTYGNLAQFLGTQRLLSQYTRIGLDNNWLVPAEDVENDPVKYRGYAPLVNTTDTNGGDPLAQYYAQPDVVTAFQTMFAPAPAAERNDAKKIWDIVQTGAGRLIGASMGFLTLGSTGFYIRNLVSIPIFSAANGFVPAPSNIATAFKGLKQVYGRDLEGLGADMIMLGVSEGSMVSQTMRDFVRGVIDDPELMSNQIEAMLKEVGTPGNFLVKAWNGVKITVDGLATLNDQIDMLYKAAYWAHEVDVQIKANKHRTVPLTPQQIKQEAARVVRLTTQGRERVAPIAKEFQRSGLGMLFNSFFRFMAEMYRIPLATIQLGVEEVKSGNPVLATRGRQRLIGLGSTLAILGYGAPALLKYMFDVEDDEEEAVRIAQPAWATDSNLFITSNPDDESITTWDITYINGFSPVTDGIARSIHHAVSGRWEKIPGVMASNLAKNFISPQIAVEAFTQAGNNRDDRGASLWLEDDPTTTKISKVLKHLANNAYKLRTPTQLWKAYQAYTNGGVSDEGARFEKAAELVAGEIMPFRVYTSKTEQLSLTAFGKLKRQLDEAKQTLGEFKSYEQLDKERVDGVYDRYETSLVAINERIRKTAKGFEKLGMSYAQMEKQAYEAGISKRRFKDAVRYGRVERYLPNDNAMKDYKRIGGPENGAARVRFIKEAAYARPQYLKLNQD